MHDSLQAILDTADSVRQTELSLEKAQTHAIGVASDNPETPSVIAGVAMNRLTLFEIDQSVLDYYRNMPRTADSDPNVELAIYINVIIRGAFADWRADIQRQLNP